MYIFGKEKGSCIALFPNSLGLDFSFGSCGTVKLDAISSVFVKEKSVNPLKGTVCFNIA